MGMTLRQKVARIKRTLRKDPQAICLRLELRGVTWAKHAEYKHTTRAWDMARIELGLATPLEITRENSMFGFDPNRRMKIVRFSTHAPLRSRRVSSLSPPPVPKTRPMAPSPR